MKLRSPKTPAELTAFALCVVSIYAVLAWLSIAFLEDTLPELSTIHLRTVVLCVVAAIPWVAFDRARARDILLSVLICALVGVFVVPTRSASPSNRDSAASRAYAALHIGSICACACVGALVGTRLRELRSLLNAANARSRIWPKTGERPGDRPQES